MTEDEAKQKWCPHVRVIGYAGPESPTPVAGNRMTRLDDECNCIASECMAWRFHRYQFTSYHGTVHAGEFAKFGYQPNERELQDDNGKPRIITHGYCGLSGVPS